MSVLSKERLTERRNGRGFCPENIECTPKCEDCEHMGKMMDKLAEYEDLEEQGLLLRLPCKVGDTVYILVDTMVVESTCKGFEMRNDDWRVVCSVTGYSVTYERFGSVFTTRAEAEEKLRELEGK